MWRYIQHCRMANTRGMDNQRSPRWFSTPLDSPLSFGFRPVRAQGRRSVLRPPALFAWKGVAANIPLHSIVWRDRAVPKMWAACTHKGARIFFERARSASGEGKERGMEEEFAAGELLEGRKTYAVGCPPSLVLRTRRCGVKKHFPKKSKKFPKTIAFSKNM